MVKQNNYDLNFTTILCIGVLKENMLIIIFILKWYIKNLEVICCKIFKYFLTLNLKIIVCVYIENMKAHKKWKYF